MLAEAGRLDDTALDALAADELVSGLLLVHGLHPYDVTTRVAGALDSVRPYLGSHGGDVELLGVDDDGVVRLRLLGSCDSCPSSTVTLQLAVEGAIQAAAPEVTSIEVGRRGEPIAPGTDLGGVACGSGWTGAPPRPPGCRCPSWRSLRPGRSAGSGKDGMALVGCRLGADSVRVPRSLPGVRRDARPVRGSSGGWATVRRT